MTLQPIYTAENLNEPAFHLRYTWSGWPTSGSFPSRLNESSLAEIDSAWGSDGMRRLETNWLPDLI